MSRTFDGNTANFLRSALVPVSGVPFAWSVWIKAVNFTGSPYVLSLNESVQPDRQWAIGIDATASNLARGGGRHDSGFSFAAAGGPSGTLDAGVWTNLVGIEDGLGSRTIVVDGDWANRGTNATLIGAPTPDTFDVGRLGDSTPSSPFNGLIAQIAVWDLTALSFGQTEVEALAARESPLGIQASGLVDYWPMLDDALDNEVRANDLVVNGTVADDDDDPVVTGVLLGVAGVTDTGAVYRAHLIGSATAKLEYSVNSDMSASAISSGVAVNRPVNFTGGETIVGLSAGTQYYYRLLVDDVPQSVGSYPSFTTMPAEGVDAPLTVVFGSCIDSATNGIFAEMAAEDPDLVLLLGDSGYMDTTVLATLRAGALALFASDFKTELVNTFPIERIIDDHDGAGNNWHGDTADKANVLTYWKETYGYWPLENASAGLWRSQTIANVEFVVIDMRFQREGTMVRFPAASTQTADTGSAGASLVLRAADSPSAVDDAYNGWYALVEGVYRRVTDYVAATRTCTLDASVAGLDNASAYFLKRASMLDQDYLTPNDQVAWLISTLNNSTARWKVLVSSVAWNPTVDQTDNDVWGSWDPELMESHYLRQEIDAENVIVLSGDRHWAGIDDGTTSHWPEATASPITRNTYLGGTDGTWSEGVENNVLHYGLLQITTSPHRATLTIRLADGTTSGAIAPLVVDAVAEAGGAASHHYYTQQRSA